MRLFAFQGIHYQLGGEEDPGLLAAPPYDQIDDTLQARMHQVSPHQFTHLTVPVPEGGCDKYENAARLHERWLAEGVIQRDPEPSLYPYEILFPDGSRRLGLCGLIGLEPPDSPAIRPHERTLAKPLEDRLTLLQAMHVDLEPALLVSEDAGALDELLAEDLEGAPVLVEHTDMDGYRHRLYRLETESRFEEYRRALAAGPGAIADGHHRYKVAQTFAAKTGAEAGTAPATKLAVVTSIHSPALTIDPIHRALPRALDPEAVGGVVASRTPYTGEITGQAFAAAVAGADQPALGVWNADDGREIWHLDPSAAPERLTPGARRLPVVLLHEVLLDAVGLGEPSWTDGTLRYRSDPDVLAALLAEGDAEAGVFLPPMDPAAFAKAVADGELLPPKSTRFLPKVVSGLVWSDHGSKLGGSKRG